MTSAKLALCSAFVASCAARPAPATTATSASTADEQPPTTSTPEPPLTHAAASGSGAYCLIVGTKQLVVRCYWTRQGCDDQVGFNTQNGLTDKSECRPTAEPRCFQYKHGELCYPSSADCEKNRTAMKRYPDERPSVCAIKTAP
jgi:hypothetical protein